MFDLHCPLPVIREGVITDQFFVPGLCVSAYSGGSMEKDKILASPGRWWVPNRRVLKTGTQPTSSSAVDDESSKSKRDSASKKMKMMMGSYGNTDLGKPTPKPVFSKRPTGAPSTPEPQGKPTIRPTSKPTLRVSCPEPTPGPEKATAKPTPETSGGRGKKSKSDGSSRLMSSMSSRKKQAEGSGNNGLHQVADRYAFNGYY